MSESDRLNFIVIIDAYCREYGVWATLNAFAEAIRPACEAQIEAEKPPKQPRRKKGAE